MAYGAMPMSGSEAGRTRFPIGFRGDERSGACETLSVRFLD